MNGFWDHVTAIFRGGLDGILADLNRTIARLEKHVAYHDRQGLASRDQAAQYRAGADGADRDAKASFAEADKAATIRDNIKRLVTA